MGTALTILLILLAVVAGIAALLYVSKERVEQKLRKVIRNFNSKEERMAVAFINTVIYKALVEAAAKEFVESGSNQGPAFMFWEQTLAYIAKGGISWVQAAKEIVGATHRVVESEFTEHGLTIAYDSGGRVSMTLPQYQVRTSNDKGAWTSFMSVSRPELRQALDVAANVTFDVKPPEGEPVGGTASIVRTALKL